MRAPLSVTIASLSSRNAPGEESRIALQPSYDLNCCWIRPDIGSDIFPRPGSAQNLAWLRAVSENEPRDHQRREARRSLSHMERWRKGIRISERRQAISLQCGIPQSHRTYQQPRQTASGT